MGCGIFVATLDVAGAMDVGCRISDVGCERDFLALVKTNRFKYFESAHEYDDAWWFFEQAKHCVFEPPPILPPMYIGNQGVYNEGAYFHFQEKKRRLVKAYLEKKCL